MQLKTDFFLFCFFSLQADSGFFCEGYSSDEDVLVKEEFRGNIIKQGCLLKQVGQKRRSESDILVSHCTYVFKGVSSLLKVTHIRMCVNGNNKQLFQGV